MEIHYVTLFGIKVWVDALVWLCVWPTLVMAVLLGAAIPERRRKEVSKCRRYWNSRS